MRTLKTQKGITMIGFAMMLCIVGFFGYTAMRLIPAYTEYYGVVKSMKALQETPNVESMSIEQIRNKLDIIFDVQYVNTNDVPLSSATLITSNGQRSLQVAYDLDIPFMYNVDLLLHFEKTMDLTRGGTY
ncbi:MAG: DUF4845 domain-containing protein [Rudaea sp.]